MAESELETHCQPPPTKRSSTEYEDDAATSLNAGGNDFGSLGDIVGDIDWPNEPGPIFVSSMRA
jgi:hypothetical protein